MQGAWRPALLAGAMVAAFVALLAWQDHAAGWAPTIAAAIDVGGLMGVLALLGIVPAGRFLKGLREGGAVQGVEEDEVSWLGARRILLSVPGGHATIASNAGRYHAVWFQAPHGALERIHGNHRRQGMRWAHRLLGAPDPEPVRSRRGIRYHPNLGWALVLSFLAASLAMAYLARWAAVAPLEWAFLGMAAAMAMIVAASRAWMTRERHAGGRVEGAANLVVGLAGGEVVAAVGGALGAWITGDPGWRWWAAGALAGIARLWGWAALKRLTRAAVASVGLVALSSALIMPQPAFQWGAGAIAALALLETFTRAPPSR
ncbi:MAG: hypothetical protein ACYDBQ_00915 [Thermoplasmatota archaeon]